MQASALPEPLSELKGLVLDIAEASGHAQLVQSPWGTVQRRSASVAELARQTVLNMPQGAKGSKVPISMRNPCFLFGLRLACACWVHLLVFSIPFCLGPCCSFWRCAFQQLLPRFEAEVGQLEMYFRDFQPLAARDLNLSTAWTHNTRPMFQGQVRPKDETRLVLERVLASDSAGSLSLSVKTRVNSEPKINLFQVEAITIQRRVGQGSSDRCRWPALCLNANGSSWQLAIATACLCCTPVRSPWSCGVCPAQSWHKARSRWLLII